MKKVFAAALLGSAGFCFAQATTSPAVSPTPGTGAGPQAPQYTPVRWNEDYLYLRDPARRTDLFDPIKYIPLNEEGDWYLSLGGQARYRYEWFENANFGAGQIEGLPGGQQAANLRQELLLPAFPLHRHGLAQVLLEALAQLVELFFRERQRGYGQVVVGEETPRVHADRRFVRFGRDIEARVEDTDVAVLHHG